MQCGWCHAVLTPVEVQRYEEQERQLEVFERELRTGQAPLAADEDLEIPDAIAPAPDHLTMVEGQLIVPTAWAKPMCDRCYWQQWLPEAVAGWSDIIMWQLMQAYHTGTRGCPQSPVMALSWAQVLIQMGWSEYDPDDPATYPEHNEPMIDATTMVQTLTPLLSPAEQDVARVLAQDVVEIAAINLAPWAVPPS